MFGKRLKHLGRYRVITTAFARNGLGFVVKDLGLPEMLSISHWRLSQSEKASRKNKSIGARIRLILEELGPTFIKMGQIASTRPGI